MRLTLIITPDLGCLEHRRCWFLVFIHRQDTSVKV